ncbi:MAG: sn-glycerol-3-phosphate ABC transporter ATP-binding protein UgpC [Alphaproteobacteria bacterium]
MASVTFTRVSKAFGDTTVVNEIDLDIGHGEFLVLVGPSGCGKSTTLRMLAGLEELTGGEIRIGERVVNDLPPRERDIAMVFQSYALYPHMTVYDNMAFALRNRGVPRREVERRVMDASRILEIGELLGRRPRHLSGGQRQRVALGRAIVREPAVFLMDEPLSNLDAQLRVTMRSELVKLHQRLRTTFVYVTHDQVEALNMGTRIAVMRAGIWEQVGGAEELYDRPNNTFVARFIGSPAMNMLTGVIAATPGGIAFLSGDATLPLPGAPAGLEPGLPVILGVRPEHVGQIDDPQFERPHQVEVGISFVEPLGGEAILGLDLAGHEVLAKLHHRHGARTGDRATMAIDLSQLHLFDAETQRALR